MPRFNINKIRSAGLRYLAADKDGQLWAFEEKPVRSGGYWRLADINLCPSLVSGVYDKSADDAYWDMVEFWRSKGRVFAMPLEDVPAKISWEDNPFDIVENGLVDEHDLKKWQGARENTLFWRCVNV